MDLHNKIIAIDFDGTLCEHRFPEIGPEVPHAFRVCKRLQQDGAKLMLWTMRSNLHSEHRSIEGHKADRDYLNEAVEWCWQRRLEFWSVNISLGQNAWTTSPKQYAHIYIDDAALGCPLISNPGMRPFVDWLAVESLLYN